MRTNFSARGFLIALMMEVVSLISSLVLVSLLVLGVYIHINDSGLTHNAWFTKRDA
jgi:hypothetical protein